MKSKYKWKAVLQYVAGGLVLAASVAFAIFFPVAPDDFLCYLTGLTNMSVSKFTAIILLCKPASILAYSMAWALGLNFLFNKF